MTYPVSEISGIGPDVADRLKQAGIRTTARLLDLAKGPKERKRLAANDKAPGSGTRTATRFWIRTISPCELLA